MPLIKSQSREAFETNVRKEIAAGKPPKQAEAIAYATRRSATGSRDQGLSSVNKRPSNSSTGMANTNTQTGGSWAEQPEPHSQHSARRSQHYHKNVAQPVDSGATKMTRAVSPSRGKMEPK